MKSSNWSVSLGNTTIYGTFRKKI